MKRLKKNTLSLLCLLLSSMLLLSGCWEVMDGDGMVNSVYWDEDEMESSNAEKQEDSSNSKPSGTDITPAGELTYDSFTYANVPAYAGYYYAEINGNKPFFTQEEIEEALEGYYEYYSPLDELGRCGMAMACLDTALMPTEDRGDIHEIHPTGWQKNSGYERSHLIAFQLCGENANELNLITGTHYLNGEAMLPFEEQVGDYVRETNTNVLYRVTPIFQGDELVCRGLLMEAYSLADNGKDICFCIFCYNVEDPADGKVIDYHTGIVYDGELEIDTSGENEPTYIVNRNSLYFHLPSCDSVVTMSERNKLLFFGTRDEAIEEGYKPCPGCKP